MYIFKALFFFKEFKSFEKVCIYLSLSFQHACGGSVQVSLWVARRVTGSLPQCMASPLAGSWSQEGSRGTVTRGVGPLPPGKYAA